MIIFGIIAAVPVYYLRPVLLAAFEGHNRFFSYGFPVLITAIVYFAVGILLLFITKDEVASALIKKLKSKKS